MRLSHLGLALVLAVSVVGCSSKKPAPERAQDAVEKGLAAHVAGRVDDALDEYQKALKIDPKNTYALYNVGLIAQNRSDTVEAERNYRAVLAIDPKFTAALFNLAIIRDGAGAPVEAIALYRKVVAITPLDPKAHLNLGFALQEVGKDAEGKRELATAVKLDPTLKARIPTSPTPRPVASPTASATP